MLNRTQQVEDVTNSSINQAGRDVVINNSGVSATDVLAIVNSVVADKISLYKQQAEIIAKQRFDDFKNCLIANLQEKANDRLDRFEQPSIQMATRNAALGYIQSGRVEEKENLIDLLIERVNVEEHTTKQHLIDKAIQVLPTLSVESLHLLAFVAFTNLSRSCRISDYGKWIASINPIINTLDRVSSLDIDFLNQADCTYNGIGFQREDFIESQLKTCDLLFRHHPSQEIVKQIFDRNGIEVVNNGYHFCKGKRQDWAVTFIEIFGLYSVGYTIHPLLTSLSYTKENLLKRGYGDIFESMQLYYDSTTLFSREEVEKYYIDINPKWRTAFDLLKRKDICSLYLKPVGRYIACRILSKLSNTDISLDIFYK